jgi:replication factor C small subunit
MDIDTNAILRGLYDNMNTLVQSQSIPQLVLILADYQYKDAFVADHELNMVACMTEIMAQVDFK